MPEDTTMPTADAGPGVDRGVGRLEPERTRTCEQGCNGCDECTDYGFFDDVLQELNCAHGICRRDEKHASWCSYWR